MKLAAGWLIEQAGWKGFRNQYVGVHDKQALVLINHHHGTQADLLSLADEIKSSIKQRFDITLDIEPLIIASSR
jgi:UDP-N-acetylmuramate dehydrogenase